MDELDAPPARKRIRSRHIRNVAGVAPVRLTKRDIELLAALLDYRLLTTTQVQKLFFRSLHRTRKRLFKLWQHGIVDRVFRPVALGDAPSEAIYSLARKGARLLTRQDGLTERAHPDARRSARVSPLFLDHTLAVNDFRIALKTSCDRNDSARLLFWRQGNEIRFEQVIVDQRFGASPVRVPVVADGLAGVETVGKKIFFFVEVDLGTVSHNRWRKRFAAYRRASLDVGLLRRLGVLKFGVLVITVGEKRMRNLERLAEPFQLLNGSEIMFSFTSVEYAMEKVAEVMDRHNQACC